MYLLFSQSFETWLKALPDTNPTSWIGLPVTAESQLRSVMAQRVLANVSILQQGLQEEEGGHDEDKGKDKQKRLLATVDTWLAALPTLQSMPAISAQLASDATASPLSRCLAREVIKGRCAVETVRNHLNLIRSVIW